MRLLSALILATMVSASPALPQKANQMTGEQLTSLLSGGRTLQLGGPGEGYSGEVRLRRNGSGKGSAVTDSGRKIEFSGNWEIRGNQFCRQWKGLEDQVRDVCEDWILTGPRSVDVFEGSRKIGANSW